MISQESRHLIERLAKKLQFVQDAKCHIKTGTKLTGLQPKVVTRLLMNKVELFEMKIEPIDRSVIYHRLVHFCLTVKKLPCTWELFEALYSDIPSYIDIDTFRKILVKMDFIWKITRTGAVVIEKPIVRLERYNYLKKILLFEQLNENNVYYIDDVGIDMKGNLMDHKLTKAHVLKNNSNQVLRVIYALGPEEAICVEQHSEFSKQSVKDWVKDSLLAAVHKPSVFILKTVAHYSERNLETPNLDSSKRDMMKWLDHHGVAYDENMSKYQLFALAEKLTDLNRDLFTIDEMVEAYGHTILRTPRCIENLIPTSLLFKAVDDILPELVSENKADINLQDLFMLFREVVITATAVHLKEFNRHILELVKSYVQKEDDMDEVLESLLLRVNSYSSNDREDSDLPSCSDSD